MILDITALVLNERLMNVASAGWIKRGRSSEWSELVWTPPFDCLAPLAQKGLRILEEKLELKVL